jgi:hypothetical protein
MQFRISPGGRMSKSRRSRPELPPSSVTVTTAVISMEGLVAVVFSGMALACLFNPERSVDKPVPPPMATTRRGLFTALVPSQCLPSLLIGIARFRIVWSFPELWRLRIRRTVVSRCGSTVDVWAFLPLLRRPEPNQDLPPQKPGRTLGSEGIRHHRGDKEIRFARADNPA